MEIVATRNMPDATALAAIIAFPPNTPGQGGGLLAITADFNPGVYSVGMVYLGRNRAVARCLAFADALHCPWLGPGYGAAQTERNRCSDGIPFALDLRTEIQGTDVVSA